MFCTPKARLSCIIFSSMQNENSLNTKQLAVNQAVKAVFYFTGVEENVPDALKYLEDWFLSGIQEHHYDSEDSRVNAVSCYRTLKTLLQEIAEIDRDALSLAR